MNALGPTRKRTVADFSWTELGALSPDDGRPGKRAMPCNGFDDVHDPIAPGGGCLYHSTKVRPGWARTRTAIATSANHSSTGEVLPGAVETIAASPRPGRMYPWSFSCGRSRRSRSEPRGDDCGDSRFPPGSRADRQNADRSHHAPSDDRWLRRRCAGGEHRIHRNHQPLGQIRRCLK